jgi:spore coat protein H
MRLAILGIAREPAASLALFISVVGASVNAPAGQNEIQAQAFFDSTNLTIFRVQLEPAEFRGLVERPRSYVRGRVCVGEKTWENVGVRLKGNGTFQPITARPSLTLKFNWKEAHQKFAGLNKLHLENSAQDASRLCKLVANGAYADGGVAAPRVTQGTVQLNGRDLGLYVVSESINKDFLKMHFGNSEGNLYEGEFRDINQGLKQENGVKGGLEDLRDLATAATENDTVQRKEALSRVLDTEEFLDFLAIEMIIANWDGYAFQQNNYRIYHDPASGRMSFIPHDLDNTFSECGMCLMPPRNGLLSAALLETQQDREAFRQRVARLFPKVLDRDKIRERLHASVTRLSQGASPAEAATIQRQARLMEQRIEERLTHLNEELAGKHPGTPVFDDKGVARLNGWTLKSDWNNSLVKEVVEQGKTCLSIEAAGGYCFGSWRLPVWLPAGSYWIEGTARTRDTAGLPSRTGSGAGVRVLGDRRGTGVRGSSEWTPVRHQFVVQEDCQWVELIAELRAFSGIAWFDTEALRLVREK